MSAYPFSVLMAVLILLGASLPRPEGVVRAPMACGQFGATLNNSQEVSPTNPTTTMGAPRPASFGTGSFTFNASMTTLTYSITVSNIDFTGIQTGDTNDNLVAAHIHAAAPGVVGPVVFGFFGSPNNENSPDDRVITPFAVGVGGTVSGKWDAIEGFNTTLTAQLPDIQAGNTYVNFHTSQFQGGEIRGQLICTDPAIVTPTATLTTTPTTTPTPTGTPTNTATPTPPPCILGDINCDGIVDIRDYGIWRQQFGATDCGNRADLDVNCLVDIRDYGIWRANFGHTAGAALRAASPVALPTGTATPTPRADREPASREGGSAWNVLLEAVQVLGLTVPNGIVLQITEVIQ